MESVTSEEGSFGDAGSVNLEAGACPSVSKSNHVVDESKLLKLTTRMEELLGSSSPSDILHVDELEEASGSSTSMSSDSKNEGFEIVIGRIEDIVVEKDFQDLLHSFLTTHWSQFRYDNEQDEERAEPSKEEAEIWKQYIIEVGSFLEGTLKRSDVSLDWKLLLDEVSKRAEADLENGSDPFSRTTNSFEIFDFLLTFTEFRHFKDILWGFKHEMDGTTPDLSSAIRISSVPEPN